MREMKDSGVEWIGEIPEDWNVGKTLYALSMPITDGPHETPELFDEGIPFISAEAVSCGNGHIDFEHIRGFISQEFYEECCKKYIPQINDIYMIKSGATTGKVAKVETQKLFTIWSPLAVFRVEPQRCYYEYLYYFIQSDAYQKQIENKWTYGTQQNIGMRTLEKLMICFPSITQQKLIADYLDSKCSKIDEIIEKQQAIIEKLKEYKLHLIQETVTKGLDRNAELRESGEIWIGKVPKHWDVLKLKSHTRMITPMRDKPEDLSGDIPWVRIEDYNGKYIDSSREGFGVSEQTVKEMNLKVYPVGSILCTSSCDLGKCAIVATPLVSNQRFINIVPDEDTSSDYLYYVMLSNADRMNHLSTGTIQANLSRVAFEHLLIQFPPLEEQKEIALYLDHKVEVIDSTIMGKEKLVEKLREYKKSLIYEVVTGKKEV